MNKNKKWKVSEVGIKEKRTYNTKAKRLARRKKEWGILALFLGLALVIIIGYGNINENEIRNRIAFAKENDQNDIIFAQAPQQLLNRQILTIKPILEPTVEQVKEEIIRQANNFDLSPQKMLDLAQCESQFDYKAKNPNSTARGVYQYLIGTWESTQSAKKGIERNDYKANIREAMIDISNGESWRWKECLIKYDLKF